MVDTSVKVILEMIFLILSNTDVLLKERELTWRSYTPTNALLITKQVQIINQKEFMTTGFDSDKKAFVVYIAYLGFKMTIHPTRDNQKSLLITEKVVILSKYLDYTNSFSKKSTAKLSKCSDINKHAINLKLGK